MLWRATLILFNQQPSSVFVQCAPTLSNIRNLTKMCSMLKGLKLSQAAVVAPSPQHVLQIFTHSPPPQLHWKLGWLVLLDFWSNGHPRQIWPLSWTTMHTSPTRHTVTPVPLLMEEVAHQVVVVTQVLKPILMFNTPELSHQRSPTFSEFYIDPFNQFIWQNLLTVRSYSTGGSPPIVGSGSNTNEPYLEFLDSLLAATTLPQTISISYGDDEDTVPLSYADEVCNLFSQLGARGVSVLVASGDSGVGTTCVTTGTTKGFTTSFPASCPWVTVVGGTTGNSPE